MRFLNRRSGGASFLLLSAVCGMMGSACVSAENDFDDTCYYNEKSGDKLRKCAGDVAFILSTAGIVGTAGVGGYFAFNREARDRLIDAALGGRYVDASKLKGTIEDLEKKIDDLEEEVIKADTSGSQSGKNDINKDASESRSGSQSGKNDVNKDASESRCGMIEMRKELDELRKSLEAVEKNPGNIKMEEDYRSKVFAFCDKIENDSVRNFFKQYLILSTGNSKLFNFIHITALAFILLAGIKTIVYGEDPSAVWFNPFIHKRWLQMSDGHSWQRRVVASILTVVDGALGFAVPYYGFVSAAVKLVSSGHDIVRGFDFRLAQGEGGLNLPMDSIYNRWL